MVRDGRLEALELTLTEVRPLLHQKMTTLKWLRLVGMMQSMTFEYSR